MDTLVQVGEYHSQMSGHREGILSEKCAEIANR
jgi:hypothetical protein